VIWSLSAFEKIPVSMHIFHSIGLR
jgi:hypothetical protein